MNKPVTKELVEQTLNDAFSKVYPGWTPERLRGDPEHMPPITNEGGMCSGHPVRNISDRTAKLIAGLRALAAKGGTRAEAAQELGVSYTYVSALTTSHAIPFRRAVWGGQTRGRGNPGR